MCATTLAALLGAGIGCAIVPRTDLLAPADPRNATRWHPPPSPLEDIKRYQPEEARSNWGAVPAQPSARGGGSSMPGMDMGRKGMKGMSMPGMDMGGGK